MKTMASLIVLGLLYVSLLFEQGIIYHYMELGLDWLSIDHGQYAYVNWGLLLLGLAILVLKLEIVDRSKEEQLVRDLIRQIRLTGVSVEKIENSGYGRIRLNASIHFQDAGFILEIKQNANSFDGITLVSRKFMTWSELKKYLVEETSFNVYEFMRHLPL